MSGTGGRTVKKARKQAIFKASCFRAFGMKQGHSLRIHYGPRWTNRAGLLDTNHAIENGMTSPLQRL